MAHKNWEGVTVRLTPEEYAELVSIADAAGYTPEELLAIWTRHTLPGTADRLLAKTRGG